MRLVVGLLGVPRAAAGRAQPVHHRDDVEQPRARRVVRAVHQLDRARRRRPSAGRPRAPARRRRREPDDALAGERPGRAAPSASGRATARRRRRRAGTAAAGGRRRPVRTGPDRSASQAGQDSRPGGTRGDSATRTTRPVTAATRLRRAGAPVGGGSASARRLAGRVRRRPARRRRARRRGRDAVRVVDGLDAARSRRPSGRSAG